MIRLKIGYSYFKIIDGYRVNESSREVTFSSLKVDFTNKTIADLPLKYQEVQLVELDQPYIEKKIIYTGYVNNFVLPKMKNRNEYRELEIDLLSPLAMATVRTADAVGTYDLRTLVRELIQPLIDDGFILKEMNINNNQISVNYLNETVESSLNKLSNKFNFWWYIDENKNIYINSIEYLMSLKPKLTYSDNSRELGIIDVIPSIDATDYCNVVNFTNVRMYTESFFSRYYNYDQVYQDYFLKYEYYNPIVNIDTLNTGDEIEFDIPIVLGSKNVGNNTGMFTGTNVVNLVFDKLNSDKTITNVFSVTSDKHDKINVPSNVTIDDSYSDKNTFVLVRDAFFSNLIVGMKYNGNSTIEVANLNSQTALKWSKLKVLDEVEINKNKGIITESGIVEKQIDMNEQWKTYDELVSIANSYIGKNVSRADSVKINTDVDLNLNVGDTIYINREEFLLNDTYIITDKSTILDGNVNKWSYTLRNTNILENYVDLFRASETEEENQKNYGLITSSYIEEGIKEVCEVS